MNRHIEKIINDSQDIRRQAWAWFKEQSRVKQGAIVVGILAVLFLIRGLTSSDPVAEVTHADRVVTLASVSALANTDTALPLLGTVTSTSEATVRSESSGKLTRVYKKLGDSIVAGAVIAEFENSGERASVLQAEGAYDAAKAARDIAKINSGTTVTSLSETKTNALNAIGSAYNSMDDAVRVKTDVYFNDARFDDAKLAVSVPDAHLVYAVEAQRKAIENILTTRESKNRTLTVNSDLISELNSVQSEVQMVKSYIEDLSSAFSKAVPDASYTQSSLDNAKTITSIARSSIASAVTSVSASRTSLNASVAASEVAGKTTGDSSGAIATADASVKQALGAYNAALSRLEKTVIRSPITGTLNSLSISTGDFISAFTEVAVVSNNGALEVLAYVTEEDARRIQVGNEVMIDNAVKGVITRIASAIDPRTKKIEVRVGINDKQANLVNGQSVRISITKSKQIVTASGGPIKIPLSALKLTPNGAFVFTMSATSSLIALPVKEGAILGEEIQILSGLNGSESIVVDARGLKEGMTVTIKQ
ncbi:MAG: HlyD family efflux transporter periplasmic adaptor subunit [Candidatus Paceibacterota bacterium]